MIDIETTPVADMNIILRNSHLEVAKDLMEDLLNLYTTCIIKIQSDQDCQKELKRLQRMHKNFVNSIAIISELQ